MMRGEETYSRHQNSCSNCGSDLPPNVRFCTHCGHSTEVTPGFCRHCGARVATGTGFCTGCGAATGPVPVGTQGSVAIDMAAVEYMGFWVRFAAWIIDTIILLVVQGVVSLIGLYFLSFIVGLVYAVLFIGLKGQTPGKMAMGIQVVNQQGQMPGVGRAILREIIGKIVSGIVIFLGFFWIGWDREKRGWHDHIAGTYVVRKQRDRP